MPTAPGVCLVGLLMVVALVLVLVLVLLVLLLVLLVLLLLLLLLLPLVLLVLPPPLLLLLPLLWLRCRSRRVARRPTQHHCRRCHHRRALRLLLLLHEHVPVWRSVRAALSLAFPRTTGL